MLFRSVSKKPGGTWSAPRTVNSEPDSAIAMGTIRGAQIAIGKDNALHIVWNGPGNHKRGIPAPLLYTRSLDGGASFEPQRDLRADTQALDGGASIASSPKGEVFIVWHGAPANAQPGEINRRVYMLGRRLSERFGIGTTLTFVHVESPLDSRRKDTVSHASTHKVGTINGRVKN